MFHPFNLKVTIYVVQGHNFCRWLRSNQGRVFVALQQFKVTTSVVGSNLMVKVTILLRFSSSRLQILQLAAVSWSGSHFCCTALLGCSRFLLDTMVSPAEFEYPPIQMPLLMSLRGWAKVMLQHIIVQCQFPPAWHNFQRSLLRNALVHSTNQSCGVWPVENPYPIKPRAV